MDESVNSPRTGILVVDDDSAIRETLIGLLEEEGYRVDAAANGRDALLLLEQIPRPSLAVVDLRMPVMDGVELIEAMRRDARWASLPILVFSAASIEASPPGIPLMRKPISIEPFLEAIQKYLAAT